MNIDTAKEMLTDMLAGEISPENLDDLLIFRSNNPEFDEYCERVECIWGMCASSEVESKQVQLEGVINLDKVRKSVNNGNIDNVLSLIDLDSISAAGNALPNLPDNNSGSSI